MAKGGGMAAVFRRPFAEQVAFFRNKLGRLVPTSRWDDLSHAAHDRAFAVAGAMKADLLADLAAAVDRAITEGKGLEAFRKEFMATIERRGWKGFTGDETARRRAWRTRIIYTTNAATSYAAGRNAQLAEAGYPFLVYRHNDSVAHPRPLHVSWDGLTLPAGHEFWSTHKPPNGWGCRCYLVGARSAEGARRLGGEPDKTPPSGWDQIDAKTGAPVGIDQGWGYAPGQSVVDEVRQLAAKMADWPVEIAAAFVDSLPESWRAGLAEASGEAAP